MPSRIRDYLEGVYDRRTNKDDDNKGKGYASEIRDYLEGIIKDSENKNNNS